MIFRQLYDAESSTFTYLVADEETRHAVLLDAVLEQIDRDLELVSQLELKLTHAVDTHVHADHITASGLLRERTGCLTVGSQVGPSCADVQVRDGDALRVGKLLFKVLATPGHTDDSVSYLLDDRVFTGDALLIRANGRTDFQNGDASQLYDSITRVLFALPDQTLIYPAHDYKGRTVTTVWEEKRYNPRVVGKSREQFIQIMENLKLPKPKKMDLAVPANRACARPTRTSRPLSSTGWATKCGASMSVSPTNTRGPWVTSPAPSSCPWAVSKAARSRGNAGSPCCSFAARGIGLHRPRCCSRRWARGDRGA